MAANSTADLDEYIASLENRLASRSDLLEEAHLAAAIDFAVAEPVACSPNPNRNAVQNCLSPYVPTTAAKISAFLSFAELSSSDVLLDIGCGDGRVCVAAASTCNKCKAIGVDVSPICIKNARELAREEGLDQCFFYEVDMTTGPEVLLNESCALANELLSATVIFLYTYPTLLLKLIPLLARLLENGNVRVVTLSYHLPDEGNVTVEKIDDENDFRMYNRIQVDSEESLH